MSDTTNRALLGAGAVTAAGALAHLAIPLVGPDAYRFFGAPEPLAQMAARGHWYPVVACLAIAAVLAVWSVYAFAGAGLVRRLPLTRTVLAAVATLLIVRGLAFVPLALWQPRLLGAICRCDGIDAFLLLTSALCLGTGLAYAVGLRRAWPRLA